MLNVFHKKAIARRDFLKLGGQCAAASFLAGPLAACAQDESGVFVGSRRAPVIDIHAHCAFEEVIDLLEGTPLNWPLSKIRLLGPKRLEEALLVVRQLAAQLLLCLGFQCLSVHAFV